MVIVALLLAYLLGSIPVGVILGRARGIDVRSVGSGNIGATNVVRALGWRLGAVAFVLDVVKGIAGPIVGHNLVPANATAIACCGVAAVLGHLFSPFLKFKGGKGISTSLGALLGLMPAVGIVCLAIWGIALAFTRMISAASIAASVALPFCAVAMRQPPAYVAVAAVMSVFAIIKHVPNMRRIKLGTEPRLGRKVNAAAGAAAGTGPGHASGTAANSAANSAGPGPVA